MSLLVCTMCGSDSGLYLCRFSVYILIMTQAFVTNDCFGFCYFFPVNAGKVAYIRP